MQPARHCQKYCPAGYSLDTDLEAFYGLRLKSGTINLIMSSREKKMEAMKLSFNFHLVWFQGHLSPSEHERRLVLHQQQRAHYDHRVCKCEHVIFSSRLSPAVIPKSVYSATQCTLSVALKVEVFAGTFACAYS